MIQTPVLQAEIDAALQKYHFTMWSGTGIDDNNLYSDPAAREAKARAALATDIATAITNFIQNSVFEVLSGGVVTVGGPTTQSNVAPAIVSKF